MLFLTKERLQQTCNGTQSQDKNFVQNSISSWKDSEQFILLRSILLFAGGGMFCFLLLVTKNVITKKKNLQMEFSKAFKQI